MAERSDATDGFIFTWTIENICMFFSPKFPLKRLTELGIVSSETLISSPSFVLKSLPHIEWDLNLRPSDNVNSEHIDICLHRNSSSPRACEIKWQLKLLICNGRVIAKTNYPQVHTFKPGMSKALSFKLRFQNILKEKLLIKCTLWPVRDRDTEEVISREILSLYENELFTDAELHSRGAAFKTHKAILYARWPKLAEKLSGHPISKCILDVEPSVLEAMIKFAYSGKLDPLNYELSSKLHAAAVQYEFAQLKSKQCSPVWKWKARTRTKQQKISFQWRIQEFSSLTANASLYSDVFPDNILSGCAWQLSLCMMSTSAVVQTFKISLQKVSRGDSRPIFVKSKINVSTCEETFQTTEFFLQNEIHECAIVTTNPISDLELKCKFHFGDFSTFSEVTYIRCDFSSNRNSICPYFSSDLRNLFKDEIEPDIELISDSTTYRVQRAILCARSPVFCRMFQSELAESSIIICDMNAITTRALLIFLYSGDLVEYTDDYVAKQVYDAAIKYEISTLKAKCISYLHANMTNENVSGVLLFAGGRNETELYRNAQTFLDSCMDEVFATNGWKLLLEYNPHLAATCLQELLMMKKRRKRKQTTNGEGASKKK